MRCNTIAFESFDDNTHTQYEVTKRIIMCHCGQLLFLSSNDRPVQSLDLAASHLTSDAILIVAFVQVRNHVTKGKLQQRHIFLICAAFLTSAKTKNENMRDISFSRTSTSYRRFCSNTRLGRARRFWIWPGRTSAWWDNFVSQTVVPEAWK